MRLCLSICILQFAICNLAFAQLSTSILSTPLSFEPNQGQTTPEVQYLSRGQGYALFLTNNGAVLSLENPDTAGDLIRLHFVGANPNPTITALDLQEGISNYFRGNDPSKWHTNIPHMGRVRYANLYSGIDLIYYGTNQGQLEYDFIVSPDADPSQIQFFFKGAKELTLDDEGNLNVHTAGGKISLKAPVTYQRINGHRIEIASAFILEPSSSPSASPISPPVEKAEKISFHLASYNSAHELVIDPILSYSTYLGGSSGDDAADIAIDSSGNAYITGSTTSTNFPTQSPFQASFAGTRDTYITKFNAAGSALTYSTYLGGNNSTEGKSIAVDASGNAYITGVTQATNFPTQSPFQASHGGSNDVFVTKLNAAGSALTYSTYLGGSASDFGNDIVVDASGNAYITGQTSSTNFPTQSPFQASNGGSSDAFVTKFNASGSALTYSTYLGGSNGDSGNGIAIDASGNAYVAGSAGSGFPTQSPFQASHGGSNDVFATKFNAAGSALTYSTFLGGSGDDQGTDIALDSSANAYVTGHTQSTDFPTQSPYQASNGGSSDAFVTKFNAAGSALTYSTYVGGSGSDISNGIALDTSGNAFITGQTASSNFPTQDPIQGSLSGVGDVFITQLNAAGSALSFSTYHGGSDDGMNGDQAFGIAVSNASEVYVAGTTYSTNYPTQSPFQASIGGGGQDAFVTKIATITIPTITSFTPTSGNVGASITITGTNFDATTTNNTVYIGGIKATVTAASTTSLTVTVPSGATFGPVRVSVSNLTAESDKFFLPTYTGVNQTITAGLFASKIDFTTGTTVDRIGVGDIDGDGKPDLVVSNFGAATISVYHNTSTSGAINSGSFAAKQDFTTGTNPRGIAIADLDGDGKLDIAVTNQGSNTMSVFRNTATSGTINGSSLATKVDFTTGTQPIGIDAGDIDGDGKPDLAVSNQGSATASVFQNTGSSGTISFAAKVDFTTQTTPFDVDIGDIDGDGKPDMAVPNFGSASVSVFHNTASSGSISSGSFATKVDFTTGTSPVGTVLGDIDGDGKLDLAVTNNGSNSLSVFRNTATSGSISSGSFAAKVDFTTGTAPNIVAAGDLDGNGKLDLAVMSTNSHFASIYHNTSTSGTISLASKIDFATGNNPVGAIIADLDGDGRPDLATPNQGSTTLSVFHNIADPPTVTSFTPTSGNVGATVTITGTNFDATPANNGVLIGGVKATVSAATSTQLTVTVPSGATFGPIKVAVNSRIAESDAFFLPTYTGVAQTLTSGTLASRIDFTPGSTPVGVALGDIDGDGKTDMAIANFSSATISVFRNTSANGSITSSSFAAKVDVTTGTNPNYVALGDIDGDGKLDMATTNLGSNTLSIFRNTSTSGSVSFATKVDFTVGTQPSGVAIRDLDGDGKPDVIATNFGSTSISVFRNASTSGAITTSSLAAKVDFATGTNPNYVDIGDIDGDGKPDIAVANRTSNTFSVFRNTSTAGSITSSSFAAKVDFATATTPFTVGLGDIDGDGKLDMVVPNNGSTSMSVFRNTSTSGSVSFATKVDFTAGSGPYGVAIGDIDGDGKPDIAIPNATSATVSFYKNTSTSGSISLNAKVDFTSAASVQSAGIADIDGDGRPELISGATSLSVFHNIADPPTITSFTPTSGNVGATVTITGTNFDTTPANNAVFFGGIKVTPSAATATQLTVTVPAHAPFAPITVTVNNRTAESDAFFLPTFTATVSGIDASTMSTKVDFTAGTGPDEAAVGDIDGDGKPDLIVTNTSDNTVSVFRNTSSSGSITTGSFAARVNFTTGATPRDIAVGDLDGDGKLDLAITNTNGTSISVLRNTSTSGTVSFATKVDFTTGSGPTGIAIGDLDGDGKPDIAVANNTADNVSIFRNTSTSGTIDANSFATKIDFTGAGDPRRVAIGDLDGDGKPDLAVTNFTNNKLSVYRNTSTAGTINSSSFAAKVDFTPGNQPYDVAFIEVDGDGKPDIAVAARSGTAISVFRNTSTSGSITTGSLAAKVDFTTGSQPNYLAIGDVDGDGKSDIAVSNFSSNSVSLFRNTATSGSITSSSFAAKVDFTTATNPNGLILTDIDGDGKPDLATANNGSANASVFHNQTLTSALPTIVLLAPTVGNVGTNITISGTNFDVSNNTVFFGATKVTGIGGSTTQINVSVPTGATHGPITVLANNRTAIRNLTLPLLHTVFLPKYSGDSQTITAGTLAQRIDFATGNEPANVAIGDVDGDGKPDLAVANFATASQSISIYRNTSTTGSINAGSFAAKVDFSTGTNPNFVTLRDLDLDGKLDMIVVNVNPANTFSVFHNTSTSGSISAGSFAAKVDFATGTNPRHIAIGDIDGDGKPDVAVANLSSNTVSVFRNTSTAGTITTSSFATKVDFATGTGPTYAAIGEIDGDGKLDLVVTNQTDGTVSIFRNTSTAGTIEAGSFATKVDLTAGTTPGRPTIVDIDKNGALDIAVPNFGSNTVSVFRNGSTSGSIGFATKVDFATGLGPQSIAIGDIDGDSKPDIAVANQTGNSISLFKNNTTSGSITSSSFSAKIDFTSGTTPNGISIGDLDSDGKPEVVVANNGSNNISIFHNIADPPTVTSFTPTSGNVGATVTITGTNFDTTPANNTVFFGATKATVSAATATQLTVTVPAHATFSPLTVTVGNRTAKSNAFFLPTFTAATSGVDASTLATKVDFATGTDPDHVEIGDLDGDGKPDIVAANQASNTVSVFHNTSTSGTIASGSFATKVDFATGTLPRDVAIGDLDGDGKLDIAVINTTSNTVSIYRNTSTSGTIASGSFATKVDFATGTAPRGVVIGDLDGDGKPEVVTTNFSSNTVSIFRNTSTSGTIDANSFATKIDFTTGNSPFHVIIGDVDGDGKPDLAVSNRNGTSVSVLHNTSTAGTITTGSFAAKVDFTAGTIVYGLAFADIDGDNKIDMAAANYSSNTVSVFRNTSTSGTIDGSSFATKVDLSTETNPSGIAFADMDGNGKPDLAVPNFGSTSVSIFPNISTSGTISAGSFAAKVDFTTGSGPWGVAMGDLDGDGKPDLAVNNHTANTISVFHNQHFTGAIPTITSFTPTSGNVGATITITGTDFNTTPASNTVFFGATKATVSAATATQLTVTVPSGATFAPITVVAHTRTAESDAFFLPTFTGVAQTITTGLLAQKVDFTTGASPQRVKIADIDGDGKPDLIVPNFSANNVSVFRNTSASGAIHASSFAAKVDFTTGTNPVEVAVGDIDGDGKPDLAVTNENTNNVSILRNTSTSGSISFDTKVDFATGTGPIGVAIGDIDGDGRIDLGIANSTANTMSVLRNISTTGSITSSSFAAKVDFTTNTKPLFVAIGDIDGDGKPDLAVTNAGTSGSGTTVSVFRNTSTAGSITTASLAAKVDVTTGTGPEMVGMADFDGDGKLDLAVTIYGNAGSGSTTSVLRNTSTSGSVSFATKVDLTTNAGPLGLALGDADGDGKIDIAAVNFGNSGAGSTVSLFKNNSTSGSISFGTKVDFTAGGGPQYAAMGDLDGDGKTDLVVASTTGTALGVFHNIADPPTIASFTPTFGSTGTTVTITGTNFSTTTGNNAVFFGSTKANVSAATATQLTVTVPTGALFAPISVTVNNRTAISKPYFLPRFTSPSGGITSSTFASAISFAPGTAPEDVAIADIDGDGKPDMAVANFSSASVSVFRNTSSVGIIGSGTFAAKADFTTGSQPSTVAVGDYDLDGDLDLAVSNFNASSVSVLQNTSTSGSVSFATKIDYTTAANPSTVAAGDIDEDGKTDLAINGQSAALLSLLRNTATAGIIDANSFATKVDLTTNSAPVGLMIGDIDADGKQDLITGNQTANNVSVFRNIGTTGSLTTSSFATKVDFTSGNGPRDVALSDVDGDGKPDVISSNFSTTTISVFRNTSTSGTISLATKADFTVGDGPTHVAIGDLDGDGKTDLAITNRNSATASILRNTSTSGSPSFATKIDLSTGTNPVGAEIADLDGDDKPDVAVAVSSAGSVSVFHNLTNLLTAQAPHRHETDGLRNANVSATFSQPLAVGTPSNFIVHGSFTGKRSGTYSGGGTTTLIFDPSGDFKAGEKTHVTLTSSLGGGKNVYTYKSKAEPSPAIFTDITGIFGTGTDATYALAFADVDTDGDLDIAIGNNGAQNEVRLNDGTGQMTGGIKNFGGASGTTATIAFFDVDGDGDMDATIGNIGTGSGDSHKLYSNDGSGNFTSTSTFGTTNSETRVLAYGDIDADGDLDIVNGNGGGGGPFIGNETLLNNGSGTFTIGSSIGTTDQNTYALVLGDIDNDGDLDVIEGNLSQQNRIFPNDGLGVFADANKINFGSGSDATRALALADIDADGDLDIATGNSGQQNVIYLNDGNSGFATPNNFGGSTTATWALDFADMDGDGDLDIVMGSDSGQNTVCLNVSQNFNNPRNFGTGSDATYAIAVADVDGDNDLDIAVGNNAQQNTIAINAQITKITSFTPTSGAAGSSVTINGAAFSTTQANNIVFFGATKATVTAASANSLTVTVPSGATLGPITVTVNNVTAESNAFFVPTFTATISAIDASTFASRVDFPVATGSRGLAVGDLDSDGKPDLMATNRDATSLSILRNTSTSGTITASSFASKVDFATNTSPRQIAVGDLDLDGNLDLVVANGQSTNISVYRNTSTSGTISLASKVDFATSTSSQPETVGIRDLDGDGKPDIVAATVSSVVSIYKNTSTSGAITTSSFAPRVDVAVGASSEGLAIGDLDGDGKPDIATTYLSASSISILRNISTGGTISTSSFATHADFASGSSPRNIVMGDIDTDGKLDLAVANSSSNSLSVYHNTSTSGSISLATKVDFSTQHGPVGVALGDLDGDGKLDLMGAKFGAGQISIFKNTSTSGSISTSSFAPKFELTTVPGGPWHMTINDLDGDGKPELTAGHLVGSSTITVFHNQTLTGALPITETTTAAGISGALIANKRQEIPIFTIGLTGDNSATLTSIALTISDLTTSTGLASSDFHGLKLYKSANNIFDGSDTQIGKQSTVNIGSTTTITPTSTETPPTSQQFYIVTALIHNNAVSNHAFKVGFAADGVTASIGTAGTAVTASDANKITIQSTTAAFPDHNNDNLVNFTDYINFAADFGKTSGFNTSFDFNSDSRIDFADHIVFARNFNKSDPLDMSILRPVGSGANSVAVPRMDFDSATNTTDNGIVTGTVTSTNTFILQIFSKSLSATTLGAVADFDIDVAKVKVTNGSFGTGLTTDAITDTSVTFMALTPVTPAGDGLLGTVTFTPQIDLTNVPTFIKLKRFVITDSAGKTDTINVTSVPPIALNGATPTAAINETAPAVGLPGAVTVTPATGIPVLTIGMTGDGVASVISATVTLSDLSTPTGLAVSDFDKLKLYKSTDAGFNFMTDTLLGEQTTVNLGTATTITATTPDVPLNGVQTYYIVVAAPSGNAVAGHAFKSDFAAGGLFTSSGNKGTAVAASDANKATISNIRETTVTAGLVGNVNIIQGTELPILKVGLTGDASSTLTGITLTISDLSTPTGLTASDFTQLKLYRSADATLNIATDALIGTQSTVNIGTATTITPTSTETPPGSQNHYIVSALIAPTAVPNHAFKVGFAAGGAATSSGAAGTQVVANDANKMTIVASNTAPVGTAQTPAVNEDTDLTITLGGTDADSNPLTAIISSLPANGALYQTSDGTTRGTQITTVPTTVTDSQRRVIYAPPANTSGNGLGTFNFKLNDGTIDGTDATITLNITEINDAPTLSALSALTINEDASTQTVSLSGIAAGTNESQTLTVTATSDNTALISNPTVTYTSPTTGGSLTFTPTANTSGTATITITVTDDGGTTNGGVNTVSQSFTVTVTEINDAPTLSALSALTINEDASEQTVSLSGIIGGTNESQTLTVTAASDNTALIPNPTVTYTSPNATGSLAFTPVANANGTATITVTVTDDGGTTNSGVNTVSQSFTVTVTAVGDPPTAVNDDFTVIEDTPTPLNVIANDSHPDGITFAVTAVTNINGGTAQINPNDNTVQFSPHNEFSGSGGFTYTITDANGNSATATVSITINPFNDSPIANADDATTNQEQAVTIDVLANDSDPEGSPLSLASVSSPGNGTASISGSSITYTPNAGFFGNDGFTYSVSDGASSSTGDVNITVIRANRLPEPVDDIVTLNAGTSVNFDPRGNDTDPDGDPLGVTSLTDPQNGRVVINSDGTVYYQPNAGFNGDDAFTYTIDDGHGGQGTATVNVNVQAPPGTPTANADNATTDEDTPITIGVLSNDDADGADPLALTGAGGASNGSTIVNEDGTVTYTPNANFAGQDQFTYGIRNALENTASGTVTVTINPINDAPIFAALDIISGIENTPIEQDLAGAISDPDNTFDQLTIEVVSTTAPIESATLSGSVLTIIPGLEQSGDGTVILAATDPAGARTEGSVPISIAPVNNPPIFDPTAFAPADGATGISRNVTLSWLANDPDNEVRYDIRLGEQANVLNTIGRDVTAPTYAFRTDFGKTHYWQIVATDGNSTITSAVRSFTVETDTQPPALSRIDASDVTDTSARITFRSDEPATGSVRFDTQSDLANAQTAAKQAIGNLKTEHTVELPGLTAATTYYYRAIATDAAGNEAQSDVRTFTTQRAPDLTPPVITGPFAEGIGHETASVRFATDELTTTTISDGTTSQTITTPALDHLVTLTGLQPQTEHTITVTATDAAGNTSTATVTFTTRAVPDVTPPAFTRRPNFNATHISATISFELSEPATVSLTYGPANGATIGSVGLGPDIALSTDLTGLEPATDYTYNLTATDASGNTFTSSTFDLRTLNAPDIRPPIVLEGPASTAIGQTEATLVFKTDEPAFSRIIYDTELSDASPRTALSSDAVTEHTRTLTGLVASTTYTYRIDLTDAAGNAVTVTGDAFTTTAAPDTAPPIFTASPIATEVGFDRITAQWSTNEASTTEVIATPVAAAKQTTVAETVTRIVPDPVTDHRILIPGLTPNTIYTLTVRSVDAAGNVLEGTLADNQTLPEPDILPPQVVVRPFVQKVTDTRVLIIFELDEPADGFIDIDTDPGFGTRVTQGSTDPRLRHEITFTGLTSNTQYYYRMRSTDVSGNGPTILPEAGRQFTVTTRPAPDTAPPNIIEGPVAISPSQTSVTIKFRYDEPATGRVRFATDANTLDNAGGPFASNLSDQHQLTLTGLSPDTEYFYRIEGTDGAKNGPTISPTKSFRTQKEVDRRPPRILSRPTAIDITHNSALITWRTNEPATSEVIVRNGPRASRADAVQEHSVLVTGLNENRTYRYEVRSTDAAGNTGRRTRLRFRTRSAPDTTPPNILEGPFLSYRSDRQITVSLRTDEPTRTEVVVFSSANTLPTVHGFNRSTNHNITVTGLEPGLGYSYRVVATDGAGNQTVAGNLTGFSAKPGVATKYVQPPGGGGSFFTSSQPDTQFPVIIDGPTVIAATSDAITIEWSTDESADSGVSFGIDNLTNRIEDGADVTSHRVVLTDLTPGTTYQYQVESTDPAGNGATTSRVFLAKTAAGADETPPQLIADPKVIYITERTATLSWLTDEPADTFVDYGIDSLNTQKATPDFVLEHQITLTNLTPATTYQYQISATDEVGNESTPSTTFTFTTESTPDTEPPTLVGPVEVGRITESSATIIWATSEMSDSAVKYGLRADALGQVAGSAADVIAHQVILTNLLPATSYSFVVESTDRSDNGPVVSDVFTFTTTAGKDETPPGIPQDLIARGGLGEVVLTWTPVSDTDVAGYDILRDAGDGTFTPIATQIIDPLFRDTGLDTATTYNYQIRAIDRADNFGDLSTSAIATPNGSGLPTAPTPQQSDSITLTVQNPQSAIPLTYTFEIAANDSFQTLIAQVANIPQGDGTTTWQIDVQLEDGKTYYWRSRTSDGVFFSPYSPTASFTSGGAQNIGDFDNDRTVSFPDFLIFASAFGTQQSDANYNPIADLNADGKIDFSDFLIFASVFGTTY